MRLVILHKAKYIKRWKDKTGKWQYQYNIAKPKPDKPVETPKFKDRVPPTTRKRMRKEIQNVLKPTYFKEIPIDDLDNALHKYGYRLSDEDGTPWNGILIGADSHTVFKLSNMNGNIQKNTGLQLSWHKMSNGKYEVTGYIT